MPRRHPTPTASTVADRLAALLEAPGAGPATPRAPEEPGPGSWPPVGASGTPGGWVPQPPRVEEEEGDEEGDQEEEEEDKDDKEDEGDDEGQAPEDAAPDRVGRHRAPVTGPRLVTLPMSLDRARLVVSWPAVVGVVALLVVAAAVFAVRVGAARAAAQPREAPAGGSMQLTRTASPTGFPTAGAPVSGAAAAGPGAAAGSSGSPAATSGAAPPAAPPVAATAGVGAGAAAGRVVVEVAGMVVRPGVRTLAAGARVTDALRAAGGARPGADLARLNLARVLLDGEQLFVPAPGQDPPPLLGPVVSGVPNAAVTGPGTGTSGPTAAGPVDLNTADLGALDGLPGVGPVLAQRILDWRTAHGRFSSVDELSEVSGIGDKVLAALRPLVTV